MTVGKPFPKGKSGNAKGRPPGDPITKKFREINNVQLIDCLTVMCALTKDELLKVYHDEKTPSFQLVVARIIGDAIKGKPFATSVLLERLCGKVKERVEHSGLTESQVIIQLPAKE